MNTFDPINLVWLGAKWWPRNHRGDLPPPKDDGAAPAGGNPVGGVVPNGASLESVVTDDDIRKYLGEITAERFMTCANKCDVGQLALYHERLEIWYLREVEKVPCPCLNTIWDRQYLEAHAFALKKGYDWLIEKASHMNYFTSVSALILADPIELLTVKASAGIITINLEQVLLSLCRGFTKGIPTQIEIKNAVEFYWKDCGNLIDETQKGEVTKEDVIEVCLDLRRKLVLYKGLIEDIGVFKDGADFNFFTSLARNLIGDNKPFIDGIRKLADEYKREAGQRKAFGGSAGAGAGPITGKPGWRKERQRESQKE